eukprot:1841617-Lingulodinium_polyedra.AAC.1
MRECRQSLEGEPVAGWDDMRGPATAEVAAQWGPQVAAELAAGRVAAAMIAFEAAATEWLGRRRGAPDERPPGGPPGRSRAPAVRP